MLKLVYIYIEKFRGIEMSSLNLSSEVRFSYCGGRISIQRTSNVMPSSFYSVSSAPKSNVVSVSALVGKNGSGKTTIAAFIELFLAGYSDMPHFVLALQDETGNHDSQSDERIEGPRYLVYCNFPEGNKLDVSGVDGACDIRYWKDRYSFPEGQRVDNIFDFIYYSPYFSTERVIGLSYGRAIAMREIGDTQHAETVDAIAHDIAEPRRYMWDLSQTGVVWDSNNRKVSSNGCLWEVATEERVRIFEFLHEVMKRHTDVLESQFASFLKCP